MTFKLVAVICLIAVVAAGDYEYNKLINNSPASSRESNSNISNQNVVSQNSAQKNNNNVQDTYETPAPTDNSYQQQDKSYDDPSSSAGDRAYNVQSSDTYQAAPVNYNQQYGFDYNSVAYYPPAKYDYSYSVNEPITGDIKSQSESRDGYYVRGTYSLVDPDGYKRTVTYTADNVNGFNAVVNRDPIAVQYTVPAVKDQSDTVAVSTSQPGTHSQDAQKNLVNPSQFRDSYAGPPAQDGKGPYK